MEFSISNLVSISRQGKKRDRKGKKIIFTEEENKKSQKVKNGFI